MANMAAFGLVAVVTWRTGPDIPVRWFAALGLAPDSIRWHTPFTYWLLHEHLLHLSVNMLLLFVFGSAVERAMGRWRFALLFVAAAALTGLCEAGAVIYGPVRERDIMVIGASGPVAWVLGVFAACFYRSRLCIGGTRIRVPVVPLIAITACGEMVSIAAHSAQTGGAIAPSAAHWAHIAGFLLGIGWAHASGMVATAQRDYRRKAIHDEADGVSPFAAAEKWESVVRSDPTNREAVVRWIEALRDTGDRERAASVAAEQIAHAMGAGQTDAAVRLYGIVADLNPLRLLTDEQAMALASAVSQGADSGLTLAAYDAVAASASDERTRRKAQLRAIAWLLRSEGLTPDAQARLQAFLASADDPEDKAYLERLAAEARNRASDAS
ncbi:MAG: rhomboid family intramembrane serine protease [Chthonomonadales bacterium]|nr:rhomboid family intramembrane serine protease [Chthonomonadales bacterium]